MTYRAARFSGPPCLIIVEFKMRITSSIRRVFMSSKRFNSSVRKEAFIFVGMCQANNNFSHKKSAVHFTTVGLAI